MCDCSAVPAVAQTEDIIDLLDTVASKARQLEAILIALSTPAEEELTAETRNNVLWCAIDLSGDILSSALRIHLRYAPPPGAPPQGEVAHGAH